MSNTLLRQWAMLKRIPRHPSKISTRELLTALNEEGFSASQRTVQRDLKILSGFFPDLRSDGSKDVAGWFWEQNSAVHDFPGIDPPMALTFKLAEQFLSELIPPALLELIRPYFDCSEQILGALDQPELAGWKEKVRIVPRTQPLIPAAIDDKTVAVVYEALLHGKQFRGRYRRRDGDEAEYDFHPLGLVFRDSVVYLVATVWNYHDPRHYALHRFQRCQLLDDDARSPADFDLDHYIASGTFEYTKPEGKPIKLTTLFTAGAAHHLRETPLSADQQLTDKKDGRAQLTATVKDSQQLRWWLLGFGDQVEVIRPKGLREEFRAVAEGMWGLYG
jgi:predicted DNA-binding transcriptional regulator YafY